MQKFSWILFAALSLITPEIEAKVVVEPKQNSELFLSVYDNIALVRDVRNVKLPSGENSIIFSGISSQILPESVIVNADGVSVKEQNYNYEMLSPANMIKENIGNIVKTVVWDENKSKNIYDKARIIDIYSGKPVLQFGYGIEFDFEGRIIWDSIPENLRSEPSLSLLVDVNASGDKILDFMYLTRGVTWNANYVAKFVNDKELNLKSWVSITNNSGIAYDNAVVQIVAGDVAMVNQSVSQPKVMMLRSAKVASQNVLPNEMSVGDYHVFTLPDKISIADKQTKQVSLLSKDSIKYSKKYKFSSPLFLGFDTQIVDFKKLNSEIWVDLVNNKESNLGEPLPKGNIRFYDEDNNGNILFVGEAIFNQMAEGEEDSLYVGKSFDVVASGKIIALEKITKDMVEAEVNISFLNAKTNAVKVVFEQSLLDDWEILSENIKGTNVDALKRRWELDIPSQGSTVLNFKVRFVRVNA